MPGCDAACKSGVKKAIVREVGLRTCTASGSKQTSAASWNAASSGSACAAAAGADAAALLSATAGAEQPAAPLSAGRCPPAGACSPTPAGAPTCGPPSLGSAVPAAAPARPWDTLPKGLAGGVPHPRPPAVAAAASRACSTSSSLPALASGLLEALISSLPCSILRCASAGAASAPGAACGLLAAGVAEGPDSVRGSPAQHLCAPVLLALSPSYLHPKRTNGVSAAFDWCWCWDQSNVQSVPASSQAASRGTASRLLPKQVCSPALLRLGEAGGGPRLHASCL